MYLYIYIYYILYTHQAPHSLLPCAMYCEGSKQKGPSCRTIRRSSVCRESQSETMRYVLLGLLTREQSISETS